MHHVDHQIVRVVRLPHAREIALPVYATDGSAAVDLRAAVTEDVLIRVGGHVAIPTGLTVAIPPGYELQVRPRSGLALKSGVTVLNSPGTIDSDYRGEILVILKNHGVLPVTVRRGDRIAQAVLKPVARIEWHEVAELDETERGTGGFGSTGIAA